MVEHTAWSPFPFVLKMGPHKGRTVVDERCWCGELRSNHLDTLGWGHGSTPDGRCKKYTWRRPVFADGEGDR